MLRLMSCILCELPSRVALVAATELTAAFLDGFPVNPGHTLVIPRRHVADPMDLEDDEWVDLWAVTRRVRADLVAKYAPAGFNVGFNAGFAAGQTVAHAHVHVIPRFEDDVPDPRGGIRWVVPERAKYWDD